MFRKTIIGLIAGMMLSTSAFSEITNRSGDFDTGALRDMVEAAFMCKSAEPLFDFYEKVPPMDKGRMKWVQAFLNSHFRSGDCWEIRPSSALLVGFRYADVKRADKKLPSLVIIPRIVNEGKIGFVLPVTLRMNLPDLAHVIQEKNNERGWPAIQIGDDEPTAEASSNQVTPSTKTDTGNQDVSEEQESSSIDDLISKRTTKGWTRPPSARNGMAVVLQVNMSPDGTVTSVSIATSSGDSPFDNSAVKAVKSISPLSEMSRLTPSDYKPYRSFKMTLRPEDLTSE